MKNKPTVGQKVRFNDYGLSQVFGSSFGLGRMKEKVLTITWVDEESATDGFGTWPVEVDDQEITCFLIDNHCFDEAFPADGYAIIL